MANIEVSKYSHSPVHKAIAMKDYTALRKILTTLPRFCDPSEIRTESASMAEEQKADVTSAVIDRRDVPNRDTPLHLAIKLGDQTSTEMLMIAGADWSLQNEQGWSPLQEAICNREETIAKIIVRHYHPLAWAKWCRRLPRLVQTMKRMRDFYMEITFNFESSVIPFISRIAPSDTYKIWKRGANLRADMTLAGFDGFRIQRSDQSILFLGEGSEDGKVIPGSLCIVTHKDKEVMNALDGAGVPASEVEVQQEVAAMSQTNIIRPGIDVTEAVLLPQMTWRRQEKSEMVGPWKAKVYDMHNVVVSIRSRRVPGAMTDEELFSSPNENETEGEDLNDLLTEEEKKQLEVALKLDGSDLSNENGDGIIGHRHSCYDPREGIHEDIDGCRNGEIVKNGKKEWLGGWRKRNTNTKNDDETKRIAPPRSSLCVEEKVGDLLGDEHSRGNANKPSSSSSSNLENKRKDGSKENEYKKGLRPVLWLAPNFPLTTEELLPLLDILANKVKAIRRLRELLTTKLPKGSFPVKILLFMDSAIYTDLYRYLYTDCLGGNGLEQHFRVFFTLINQVAIPVVPTIRVLVTFTKFEEIQPTDDFSTPPSSPLPSGRESPSVVTSSSSSSSWFQWIKTPYHRVTSSNGSSSNSGKIDNLQDPFAIPRDYTWVTAELKKKRMQEKGKLKKKNPTQ